MTRRAWGVVVLAVVVLAAVVGPSALDLGRGVTGAAARTPIPGPPAVGDCLTSPPVGAGSALTFVGIAIAVAPYAACPAAGGTGRAFGEIVSVTPDVHAYPSVAAYRSSAPDPNACRRPARDYLGWTADPWNPVLLDTITLVGPDAGQYASGQQWLACAVAVGDQGYPGAIRDNVFGRASDLYGRCQDTREDPRARVACDDPHDEEVFGTALVGPGGQAALDDSCSRLVAQRTGLTDPTGGGRLRVRAGPDDPNTVPPDVSASRQSWTCSIRVVGDGRLVHGLTGLGERPLPWS